MGPSMDISLADMKENFVVETMAVLKAAAKVVLMDY